MARKDILGFPYAECENCTYKAERENINRYGARTGGMEISCEIRLTCGKETCELERLIGGAEAPSTASETLLNSKEVNELVEGR